MEFLWPPAMDRCLGFPRNPSSTTAIVRAGSKSSLCRNILLSGRRLPPTLRRAAVHHACTEVVLPWSQESLLAMYGGHLAHKQHMLYSGCYNSPH